jgi:hypothetical protein
MGLQMENLKEGDKILGNTILKQFLKKWDG